VRRNSEERRKY